MLLAWSWLAQGALRRRAAGADEGDGDGDSNPLLTLRARDAILPLACAGCALLAIGSLGPTAVWRHAGIGAGQFVLVDPAPNMLRNQLNWLRRATIWEADGVESSVALFADNGLAFYVNGRSDGNAASDAGTQIMLPLIGALLHPEPRSALIVGLGTGESAGWLADVDSIERLDVVELEPVMVEVAKACAVANRHALDNPKISLTYDDAREFLLTSPARYDLIISEPSNPYRTGIAGLYTQEFYRSLLTRLNDDGLFLQWLQTYEIDTRTVRTVMATLSGVFDHIELWQTRPGTWSSCVGGGRQSTPPKRSARRSAANRSAPPWPMSGAPATWKVYYRIIWRGES